MRVLLTHRYFWPDSPAYAAMLRTIAEGLAEAGHEVHVFASKPSYRRAAPAPGRERLGKLRVRRVPVLAENKRSPAARGLNVLIYCAALFARILALRPDVVSASTFPPVAAAWTASLAARLVGARFVYHMQDVHPEVSRLSGGRLGRGLPYRLLRRLDTQTLGRAAAVVVLSDDMAATLRERPGTGRLPIRVINNFELDAFERTGAPPAALAKRADLRRVIFAGNLGRFQNLPLLAEGVATCFPALPHIELFFLGDGEALDALKARWQGHEQVRFAPFLPFAEARELIAGADVGVVSLARGIHRVSYPSKVLTYAALGLPMLALVEPESALARDVRAHNLGVVPEAETPQARGAALMALLGPSGRLEAARAAVRRYHAERAGRAAVLGRWRDLVGQMEPLPAPRRQIRRRVRS